MTGNTEVVAGFQSALNSVWALAAEYKLVKNIFFHKDMKGPAKHMAKYYKDYACAASAYVKQILFLGGKPVISGVTVTDDYASCADIFARLTTEETALRSLLNTAYSRFIDLQDSDSAHDLKDIIHLVEKHMLYLEKQSDAISELGEINYRTAKIV